MLDTSSPRSGSEVTPPSTFNVVISSQPPQKKETKNKAPPFKYGTSRPLKELALMGSPRDKPSPIKDSGGEVNSGQGVTQ
jgi:hypothetical protein